MRSQQIEIYIGIPKKGISRKAENGKLEDATFSHPNGATYAAYK